jgi:protease I
MRAMMVIAPAGFQDREYSGTRAELDKAGIEVDVFSTQDGMCKGAFGSQVEAKSMNGADSSAYDAIVFIGGPGTPIVRSDENSVRLAQEFFRADKLVCAICWAPTILAKAGILQVRKATVWIGIDREYGGATDRVISKYGGIYTNRSVVEDGNVITASGPEAASEFGYTIAMRLKR